MRTIFYRKTLEIMEIYWELVRIIVPVAILTQLLQEHGAIRAISPFFEPFMTLLGLPPELALSWLTALLVGIWGGVISVFTLVPASSLTTADMTVLSALFLVAHAIPIEQRIIQKAGPGFLITAVLRIGGAFAFAAILHQIFSTFGLLASPLHPAWTPMGETSNWWTFLWATAETLLTMLGVLIALIWTMELFKALGIMAWLNKGLEPLLRLAAIDASAVPFASVGLFLGISYGGGLLIRESRAANIDPRQIFLASVFMGFTHSIIEDTLLVMALGADFASVFLCRLVFAVVAMTLIAKVLSVTSDTVFYGTLFRKWSSGDQLGDGERAM
jgi:spore maturation protein SpmB